MKKINLRKKWITAAVAFCMMVTTAAPISATEAKTPDNAVGTTDTVMAADTTNDDFDNSTAISMGTTYSGKITTENKIDFYQFTVTSPGTVTMQMTSRMDVTKWYLYDSGKVEMRSSGSLKKNTSTGRYDDSTNLILTQGTYYIHVQGDDVSTGEYNLTLTFAPSGESFPDSGNGINNTVDTATPIKTGVNYKGQLAINDGKDCYAFTATAGTYIINIEDTIGDQKYWRLYDSYVQEIASGLGSSNKKIVFPTAGTYYFIVEKWAEYMDGGNYTFSITEYIPVLTATTSYTKTYKSDSYYQETFNLDAKSSGGEGILYASSDAKVAAVSEYGTVTITGPGKAVITATVKGFPTIQKKITVTVKPAKVASLKAKRTAKNKMTVSWKRDKTVTGYELTYALNKKFTKGKKTVKIGKNKTVKKTIKKLKANKAYYVKVRSYKISGGEKIYGAYSKTVKIKVKK